ncbi:MAG: GSCFA domain-containing protein [Bacteroidia bacterium]
MKHFRTEISIPPLSHPVSYATPVLACGSCFADRMGLRLEARKFPVKVNPLGIIYNPVSLTEGLRMALEGRTETRIEFAPHLHAYHSFHLHSRFNHPDRAMMEAGVNQAFEETGQYLRQAGWLFVTLGTAWVFREKESGEIVANCHKYPSERFTKDLLSPAVILDSFLSFFRLLFAQNPHIRVLMTVSPVRHIKEGLSLNSVSKATLRLVCHQLVQALENVHYFPAYEIMSDDLRDYRFYGADMIHPSDVAEDYIWEKFADACFSAQTRTLAEQAEKIKREMAHRPMNPDSPEYIKFLERLLEKANLLHTSVDCTEEIQHIRGELSKIRG